MATNVTFNGVTYSVPAANEEGWQALSNYLIALAGASVSGGSQSLAVRVATTATVTAATSDGVILINRAGAVTVNLPAGVDKQVLWIGDVSGAAETNNITINRNGSNTIFGGTSYVLNQNNQVACFIFSSANGNWNRIAESKLPANGAAATLLKSDGTKLLYDKLVDADVDAAAAIDRTKLASGSANHVIINDGSGVLSSEALLAVARGGTGVATSTGSGSNVLSDSPTLVTPNLGTPSALTLTNATGLPIVAGTTGTLSVARGGTGVTSSTGTGSTVLSNSPTLVTPALGTPSALVLTNATGLPMTTGVTGVLPVANGGTGLSAIGSALQVLRVNAGATALEFGTLSGGGDVFGPGAVTTNNELALFASGTGGAIKGIGGLGSTGQFLGTPFGSTPAWTNQGSFLALTDATNQLELGSGGTKTTISSPAKAAASVYTIPDAGTAANFVMDAGTNVIGGTLTLPATVNYTGVGSIAKAGAGALTLSASGTFTLTVPATGTADLIGEAQTISAIKTHSAAITFTGGAAANGSIWFASNVLRQRGGTSGWAVDNTSGTAIISATDAGAWALGPSGATSGAHQFNGSNLSLLRNGIGRAGFAVATNEAFVEAYGQDNSTNGILTFRSLRADATNIVTTGTVTVAGAWTLGPASANLTHTLNGNATVTGQSGTTLALYKSSGASFLISPDATGASNTYAMDNSGGTLRFYNHSAQINATATQAGAWTLGPTNTDISHRVHAAKATAGPVLIVQGYGTAGAYLNISEEGIQDWYMGMDNSNNVLKIRPTSTVTASVAEVTTAGAWTLGPASAADGTVEHVMRGNSSSDPTLRIQNQATAANASNSIVGAQYSVDADCTGGRFFVALNSAGGNVMYADAVTNTTGNWISTSDARLKEDFQSFEGLTLVNQMLPKNYKMKDSDKRFFGFVAQELKAVVPNAVSVGSDDVAEDGSLLNPWGIDYGKLTPILAKAIQELHAELQALKAS